MDSVLLFVYISSKNDSYEAFLNIEICSLLITHCVRSFKKIIGFFLIFQDYIKTSCVGTLGLDQLRDVKNYGRQLNLGD